MIIIQPPSTQGQAPHPLPAVGGTAGGWLAVRLARGEAAPAHILPCMDHTPVGAHYLQAHSQGWALSRPLLPFASVRGGAVHSTAPLLYLRVCACVCMERRREADGLSSRRNPEQGNQELRLEGER